MRKPKLEKITGLVALSYLVLIPVGGFIIWQKVKELDKDIDSLWLKKDADRPRLSISENVRDQISTIFPRKEPATRVPYDSGS